MELEQNVCCHTLPDLLEEDTGELHNLIFLLVDVTGDVLGEIVLAETDSS